MRAIEAVHAGDSVLLPTATRTLVKLVAGDADRRQEPCRERLSTLSARGHEVALAVGRGLANAEMAAELYMSVATVKAHASRLLTKLGLANRVQIALFVQHAQR